MGAVIHERALNLSLYLVTDTRQCGTRGVVSTVREAIAAGVTVVQLRDPDTSDDEFVALGRLVSRVLRPTPVPLLVNDRHHLVGQIQADGVHLGQSDADPVTVRAELGPQAWIGLSASTEDDVDRAADLISSGVVDYLGVGPVWSTATKPEARAPIGPDGLAALVARVTAPCVAIGGISVERAATLRHTGVAGIAVVSAICSAPGVAEATTALQAAWSGSP